MGKYSTYRKRGSSTGPTTVLAPPPAPLITLEDEGLHIHAEDADDTGGTFNILSSHTLGGPAFDQLTQTWSPDPYLDYGDFLPGVYVHVREEGNNILYAGLSPRSNEVLMPG